MKTLLSQEKTQMASICFSQNGDCASRAHVENLLPPNYDYCRETEVSPQIPSSSFDSVDIFGEPEISLRIGDEYQAQLPPLYESHSRKRIKSDPDQNFLIGLPIMLTWINTSKKKVSGPQSRSRTSSDTDNKVVKTETVEELHNLPTAEKICKFGGRGYILVPGLVDECWNALEKDSFLLGLYIFEKNFVEVRRFVGAKEMGAILYFYYGSFYGSREYRRWSDCRKAKGKKGIYGQRIFSGVRHQELLNRVFFGVSEECRNSILEVSKAFEDEKISLSEYVFSLKTMVGVKILVDAISIGRGKLDLTEMPLESSRSNPTRPEIPTGKALSSLTTDEIIKFLSPNYRLSKTRSNDIFWEAVWPRLLARGWHSEQPKNQGFGRHCLVFLIPGIKKFSRRKLVKGEHYFDSLMDVLSKVSKEPELINLDSQEGEGCREKKEDYESPSETKSEKHCYLQPRTPSRKSGVMKFTVVDTSLSNGKIRELRAFPCEIPNTFTAQECKEDDVEDIAEDKSNESNSIDILTAKYDGRTALVPYLKNKKNSREDNRMKKIPKPRKMKRDNAGNVGPVIKRCRTLTATGGREETNVSNSGDNEVMENLFSEAGPAQDKASTTGSWGGGPGEDVENNRPQLLIDLNFPQISPESENVELGVGRERPPNEPDNGGLPDPPANQARTEQLSNLNPRRLSTRYRPPTVRALEAVADGYLSVIRKRKGKSARSNEKSTSRRAKRAGGVVGPREPSPDPVAHEVGESEKDEVSNSGNSNEVVEPQVPSETNMD